MTNWVVRSTVLLAGAALIIGCGTRSGNGSTSGSTGNTTGGETTGGETTGGETTGGETTGGETTGGETTGGETTGGETTGDNNNSFDEAGTLVIGEAAQESLNPTADVDYWTFEGTAGLPVAIFIDAQDVPFEDIAIDSVITLYDADKKVIAINDDPFPRTTNDSSIFTILPKDGTYYLRVEECTTWLQSTGVDASCAQPVDKKKVSYTVLVIALDPESDGNVASVEGEEVAMGYGKSVETGNYFLTLVWGMFDAVDDEDVFTFNLPADTTISQGRSTANFDFYPAGEEGNGSTATLGATWVTTADAPEIVLAYTDGLSGDSISMPADLEKDYVLYVSVLGDPGDHGFYFFNHAGGGSNPVEAEDETNTAMETPEKLENSPDDAGSHYFIDGDITAADTDVDWFLVEVPESVADGTYEASIACGAQRSGSGLRGFTYALHDAEGVEIKKAKESKSGAVVLEGGLVPAGTETLLVRLSAESQADDVAGTYYRCGLHITQPIVP